jgi:hypothetical protein
MLTLEESTERGVVEHERFLADLKAMDYAWLQSTRSGNSEVFDQWLNTYIQREASRAGS